MRSIPTEFLSPTRVAEDYPITERWLERRRSERRPPSYTKAGRHVLYRRDEIENFLNGNTVQAVQS
jgi:hypothetical protein